MSIGVNIVRNNLISFKSCNNITSHVYTEENNFSLQNSTVKSKETDNIQKDSRIPLARKLGIGFASLFAILYAAGMGIRRHNFNKTSIKSITEELSKVFRRDLTENETKEMISKYKDIFKINDAKTFTQEAFEQIKKDYGYEQADIPLTIKYKNIWKYLLLKPFRKTVVGGFNHINPRIEVVAFCTKKGKLNKKGQIFMFENIYHELKHMEQQHLCYLKDKNSLFNAIIKKIENTSHRPILKRSDKINKIDENYNRAYKNMPEKDISKYNDIIDRYIENIENYIDGSKEKLKKYRKQILEEEAFNAQKVSTQFTWLDKSSLFYIPKGFTNYGLIGASACCFAKDGYDTFVKKSNK